MDEQNMASVIVEVRPGRFERAIRRMLLFEQFGSEAQDFWDEQDWADERELDDMDAIMDFQKRIKAQRGE